MCVCHLRNKKHYLKKSDNRVNETNQICFWRTVCYSTVRTPWYLFCPSTDLSTSTWGRLTWTRRRSRHPRWTTTPLLPPCCERRVGNECVWRPASLGWKQIGTICNQNIIIKKFKLDLASIQSVLIYRSETWVDKTEVKMLWCWIIEYTLRFKKSKPNFGFDSWILVYFSMNHGV